MESPKGRHKILLHLEGQNMEEESGVVPYQFCQNGLAEAVNLSRNRTSKLVREMIDKGLVEEKTRRVIGLKRRRKVYTLTQKGLEKAKKIREKIEEKEVKIKTESNEYKTKLKNIDSHIDTQNPLLTALNNITENDVINLTQPEKHSEDIFSGRKDELQFLKNKLQQVKDKGSSTVLIKGKAGIGKTRLVNEFKDQAVSEGFDFLAGKGHYDTSEPYLPFKEAFGKFRNSDKANPMEFSDREERNKERRGEKEVKATQNLILSETTENISSLAEENPIVIFIDDLQWVDKASLKFFHYLTEKLEDARILLISASRSEDVDRTDFFDEVLQRMNRENLYEELRLEPLSWEDTREIVKGLIGSIDIPDDFIQIIHDVSEGNPLFSKELVKQILEEGIVDLENDKYPTKKDDIKLPDVVDDIIRRRIKELDQENLKILQTGSIIGEEVPFELLNYYFTDRNTLDLLESVDILMGMGLLSEEANEDIFYFTHGLIQRSVYENIPRLRRKEIHKQIADCIEETFKDKVEEYYSNLGFHYKQAERFSKAFEYYSKAGDKAKSVYAHEDALDMYKEALTLAEKGDLNQKKKWKIFEKVGDVNKIMGEYDVSDEYYEKIPIDKIAPKYKQRIYRKMASIYEKRGEYDKALEALEIGLAERENEGMETSKLLSMRGNIKKRQGRYDQAERDFLTSLDICENFDGGKEYADIHKGLGTVYVRIGEFEKSINHLEIALEEFEKINDLHGKSSSLNALGSVYFKKGDFNKALESYERSLELRKKIGDKKAISSCLNNIGTIYSRKGEFEKAIEYYHESLERWDEIGYQQGIAIVLINMGEYYYERNELDSALKKLKKSLDISKGINYFAGITASLANLAKTYLLKGELDEARETYRKGLKLGKDLEYGQIVPNSLNGLAEIYIREDEFEKALEKGKEALEVSKNNEAKAEEGISHKTLGMVYRKKKEWDKAEEEFEKGKKILKDIEMKTELAKLLFQYALLWKDMKKQEKMREYINEALSMFKRMDMELWIEKCEKELEG